MTSVFGRWRESWERGLQVRLIVLTVLAALALGTGRLVALFGDQIDVKAFIWVVFGFLLVALLGAGQRMWAMSFMVWIASFAIGYRTFHLTQFVSIHPSEVLIWLLFLSMLAYDLAKARTVRSPLPVLGWAFVLFWPIGWLRSVQSHVVWDGALAALIPFVEIIPVLAVVQHVMNSPARWKAVGATLAVISFYISFLGVLEYFAPGVVAPFHGFFAEPIVDITMEGFARASFSFWGSPVVAQLLLLFLPFLLAQFTWWHKPYQQFFLAGTIGLLTMAIYVSGYRNTWFLAILIFLAYFTLQGQWRAFALTIVAVAVIAWILPAEARERALNFITRGYESDSSAIDRLQRIQRASALFLRSPWFGWGWGSVRYVHNDLLQMATDLGAIAASVFLLWIGWVTWRIWNVYRRTTEMWVRTESAALLVFMLGFVITLNLQALMELPHLILPVWFLFALAQHLPRAAQSS